MNVQEALERAESWGNSPGIRPEPAIAREVATTLAEEVRRRYGVGGELIAARRERDELAAAIRQTLDENGHLADGDVCTLKVLKDALSFVR